MANRSLIGKKTKQKGIPEREELQLLMAGEHLAATAVQKRERGGRKIIRRDPSSNLRIASARVRVCVCVCVAEP